MYIENTKHAETNSESCRRENTNKTDHWKFPKTRWSDIYIRTNISRIGCWGIKKKLFDNYKNTTKYERWHVHNICISKQYTDDIVTHNMHVCRQCAETKLWIIRYMRSGKDDKQMMCTCVDNMQMIWTMCICADNVQKLW